MCGFIGGKGCLRVRCQGRNERHRGVDAMWMWSRRMVWIWNRHHKDTTSAPRFSAIMRSEANFFDFFRVYKIQGAHDSVSYAP